MFTTVFSFHLIRKNYLKQLAKGKKALGAPIYFFFHLGTDEINRALSRSRAERMKRLLLERGVPEDRIFIRIQGGIDSYEPQESNRHTRITLTL